MGNDTQEYDYTQDKSFLSAPVQTQHAYLLANNPNYATADPKTQGAYISHLRGYDKSTQFEQQNTPAKVEGSTTERAVKGVGRGLAGMGMGLYDTVRHPIDTAVGMYENAKEHWTAAKDEPTTMGKVREYGNGVPMLGPLAKSLGERYGSGDEAGAIAEGLTTAVGPSALKEAAGLASPVKRAIGRGVREGPRVLDPATQTTSKGPLRPWVKAVGGPDLLGGEKVLNAVLPAHPDIIDPRLSANERMGTLKPWGAEQQWGAFMDKGYKPIGDPIQQYPSPIGPSQVPIQEGPYKPGPSSKLNSYTPNRSIGTPITGRSGAGVKLQPGEFTPPAAPKSVDEPYKPYQAGPSAKRDAYSPNNSIGKPITGRSGSGGGPSIPQSGVGKSITTTRIGSAGDLTQWTADDLWTGYMKNKGAPLGESIGKELSRRGLVKSTSSNIR